MCKFFWLLLLAFICSDELRAQETVDYDGLTFEISNGEATLVGGERGMNGSLIIPSKVQGFPVRSIGDGALNWFAQIDAIVVPSSVTSIGDRAFLGCSKVETLIIPESVAEIGDGALAGIGWQDPFLLTDVTLPLKFRDLEEVWRLQLPLKYFDEINDDGLEFRDVYGSAILTKIDDSLVDVVVPSEIQGIPVGGVGMMTRNAVTGGGSKLENLVLPSSVRIITDGAFSGARSLKSVFIPNGVLSIGSRAFEECSGLISVSIPDSVVSIGNGAFQSRESNRDMGGDNGMVFESFTVPQRFHSLKEASRIGSGVSHIYPWGWHVPSSADNPTPKSPSVRMAPVIMVQGEEGSVKTIEVAESPDGPWRFWMDVTATPSGVAITDLDGQAYKRFYRVRE